MRPSGQIHGEDAKVRAAMDALRRIVRALRLAAGEVEREVGISVAQLFVLQELAGGAPRSINELAAAVATDPSTVSGVVRRLLDAGLVLRRTSPADGRRAELTITRRGAELLEHAPPAPQEQLVRALEELRPRLRRAVAEGLVALADRLGDAPPVFFFEDEPPLKRRRAAAPRTR